MKQYIEVVFNLPVDGSFTYKNLEGAPAELGYRVEAMFGRRKMIGFVIESHDRAVQGDFKIKSVLRIVDKEPFFDEGSIEMAKWVAGTALCTLGEALSSILPSGKRESKQEIGSEEEFADYTPRELSQEQLSARETILAGAGDYFYLFGITGSGKTEVFLQAAEKTIIAGKQVIYLVPEISLTHQLLRDISKRFDGKVAVLHSGLTPSQRLVEWNRIRRGEVGLVIGARSAIFAPVKDLGLIIIDEEHDGSYKSGNTPRYHARQIAMYRSSQSKANLVMGSATPSVEAWHLMQTGRLKRLELTKRLSGGALPSLHLINMMGEVGTISSLLREKLLEVYNEGKQSILFLNRRGFNYFFHCKSCGYEMRCEHCSVSLTYYKQHNKMKCHYCGYSRTPISACPTCGSLDVGYSGFGTELVEEEIKNLFPMMKIARVDSDTTTKKGELARILKEFREGDYDLLLGTQMVAKGLNFPGVKLVGIVLADTGLHLPDFRSAERTFSLITQVAGRAGRYTPDGMVYIQSFTPEAEAISMACKGEIQEFYDKELQMRQLLNFPPFCRVARLVFRGEDKNLVASFSKFILEKIENSSTISVVGPAECPIPFINKNHRYQMMLRSPHFKLIHSSICELKPYLEAERRVYVEIDMDPVSLL